MRNQTLRKEDMDRSYNPELALDHSDRGHLVQMASMPGYQVFHQLCRSEVDKFIVSLINAKPSEPAEVLSAQLLVKAAAQFYEGITDRVNEEIVQYTGSIKTNVYPVDPTEGLLDIGYIPVDELEEYE